MRNVFVLCAVLSIGAVALAQTPARSRPRTWTSGAHTAIGIPPSGTEGVRLEMAAGVRVTAFGVDSTITGGSVCGFYQASTEAGGDGGWATSGGLKLDVSNATLPDGGTIRSYAFPDMVVRSPYGRAGWVSCGLTGTADDGGTARFKVKTDSFGPAFTPTELQQ